MNKMEDLTGHLRISQSPRRRNATQRRHAHNYYVMGRRHAEDGALDDARRLLKHALAYDAAYVPALRTLATVELTAERPAEAKLYITKALHANPHDAEAYAILGNIALNTHDPASALDAYEHARQLGAQGLDLQFNTAIAHLFLGQADIAAPLFQALVQQHPRHQRAWDALGCAKRMLKDYQGAVSAFLQAVEIDPRMNDARDHLAQLLMETGNYQRARQVLESALALEPKRPQSRQLLAVLFATIHEYAQAAECWEALIVDGLATAETYHLLANAYLHLDDDTRARATLQALVTQFPAHLAGHLQLALLLLENGQREEGYAHLEQARALDPQHPALLQALATAETLCTGAAKQPTD